MEKSKISIIVPVYNAENCIRNAIYSILNQNYTNYEVILVNDGSTDRSREIILKLMNEDSRLILLDQENQGVSAARNTGIAHASGEYLMFVDSDDELLPGALLGMSKDFNDECSMIYGGMRIETIGEERKIVSSAIPNEGEIIHTKDINKIYGRYYRNKIFLSIWGKLYRTSVIRKHNLRFDENFTIGEDMIFIQELLKLPYPVTSYAHIVYSYMVYTGMSITKSSSIKRIENAALLLNKSNEFGKIIRIDKVGQEVFENYFFRSCFVTLEHCSISELNDLIRKLLKNETLRELIQTKKFILFEDKIYHMVLKTNCVFLIKYFTLLRKFAKSRKHR